MAKSSQQSPRAKKLPEAKFGPYAGGVGIAVWRNKSETDDGVREFRSITINTRRYLDKQSDEWRDSGSFRPSDLPAVMHGLSRAIDYMYSNPLSAESDEDNGQAEADIPY